MSINKKAKTGLLRLIVVAYFPAIVLADSTPVDYQEHGLPSHSLDHCIKLQAIDLEEEKHINKHRWATFHSVYVGRCLNQTLIKEILNDLNKQYVQQGYITTRAYLKQQNIEDGRLVINVATGSIESIVDSNNQVPNSRIHSAFVFQQDRILNLRELEEALEIMKRASTKEVTMAIKPGFFQGSSIIEIDDHGDSENFPYRLQIGLTARKGSINTGQSVNVDLAVMNPFEINDILRLSRNNSQGDKGFQSNDLWDINYSFPLFKALGEFSYAKFDYRQGVAGLGDRFTSTGETQTLTGKINKTLFRNKRSKFATGLSLKYSDSQNFFADQLLDVSSYITTQVQAGLTYTLLQPWGEWVASYSFHQGTDWFNARTDSFFAGGSEQATLQFNKHVLDTNLIYYPSSRYFYISSNLHWQYTDDLLFNNDKLTVGSDYTVRGYLDRNIFGNNAWYIKNDAVKSWNLSGYPLLMQSISLFMGFDVGRVRCEIDNASSCGFIYGSAIGLNSQGTKLALKLVWGHPWKKITNNFKHTEQFRLDLIWSF